MPWLPALSFTCEALEDVEEMKWIQGESGCLGNEIGVRSCMVLQGQGSGK
jgi:hypothetical protein